MSDVYVCMHKHAGLERSGGSSPRRFLEIRSSEINYYGSASVPEWPQKQCCFLGHFVTEAEP